MDTEAPINYINFKPSPINLKTYGWWVIGSKESGQWIQIANYNKANWFRKKMIKLFFGVGWSDKEWGMSNKHED